MHRALKLYKPRIRPLSYPSRNREPINFCLVLQLLLLSPPFFLSVVWIKVRPRFFDQVGHETMYAPSGNKHFFTKSCHPRTYQNYGQSRQKLGTILENEIS